MARKKTLDEVIANAAEEKAAATRERFAPCRNAEGLRLTDRSIQVRESAFGRRPNWPPSPVIRVFGRLHTAAVGQNMQFAYGSVTSSNLANGTPDLRYSHPGNGDMVDDWIKFVTTFLGDV